MTTERPTLLAARASIDWTREQWLAHADRLLAAALRHASPGHGRITFPGAEGGYGRAVDGLEGFARTFLLAGFRIAGERGQGVDELIDFYAQGIATGVDPDAPDRWVRFDEHAQAKVEAASLALVLDLTRPWLWDRMDAVTRRRVIDYLAPAVGDGSYPRTNWLWFRLVVQTFLRSAGGPWSPSDVAADLALHDSFVRADGWLSDGAERSYDHYVGWALHVYPVLWSRMQGADELAAGRTAGDVARLDRFLQDAIALVGGDGSPLIQGRSLIYRFAAAAPFWVGALAEVPSTSLGALRHAASSIVGHFADRGAPDADGVLTMGWHREWRSLAQAYSGPCSPYWAAKGMLGIALPADHPVWAAPAESLPVQRGDTLRVVRAAGWIVSGTAADGIVRVVNHGTDHAIEGTLVGDSPLYARLGYSTRTAPLLDAPAWQQPLEQSVALVDATGNATHRAGLELLDTRIDGDVGVGSSTWRAHWMAPSAGQQGHGSGIDGEPVVAGRITTHSLVHGPWEVRLVRVDALEPGVDASSLILRVGGWVVSGDAVDAAASGSRASVRAGATSAGIHSLDTRGRAAIDRRMDASPLGAHSAVAYVDLPVSPGDWFAVLVHLSERQDQPAAAVEVRGDARHPIVDVTWPDDFVTTTMLATRENDGA